jgi:O-antigen/teichoic acid export membrane protein
MHVPSLRQNVAWSFVGSVALAVSQFAIIIALSHLGDGDHAHRNGTWNWALTLTGPVFVLGLLRLRQVQTTDARGEHSFAAYLQLRGATMLAGLLGIAAVVALAYRDRTGLAILGVAVAKACEGGSDVVYGYLGQRERMRQVALSQLGRAITSLALAGTTVALTSSVALVAWAVAAVYAAWMIVDLRAVDAPLGPLDRAGVGALFRLAWPLGVVSAIGSLQIYVPRYFVEYHTGRVEQGAFSNLIQILQLGTIVVSAMTTGASARMARAAAARDYHGLLRTLKVLVLGGLLLGAGAVIVSATIGEWLLGLVFTAETARHADVLVWLAVTSGLVWSYVFLGTTLDALRSFRVQPWIHGASTAVIAGAAALLVPSHGLVGAAWAMLIGFGVECALYVIVVAIPLRRLRGAAP